MQPNHAGRTALAAAATNDVRFGMQTAHMAPHGAFRKTHAHACTHASCRHATRALGSSHPSSVEQCTRRSFGEPASCPGDAGFGEYLCTSAGNCQ